MNTGPIRVFLVDDHPIVEAGLKLGFSMNDEFLLIGSARSHDQALARVEESQPDVIISDLVINGDLDLNYLDLYREVAPNARIVAFSSLPEETYADKCRAAGADAYVSKSTSPHEVMTRLKQILTEEPPRPEQHTTAVTGQSLIIDGVALTPRECDVGLRLARGQSTVEIAADLGISKKTAAIHRDNLRNKLHCATSNELIALLARNLGKYSR